MLSRWDPFREMLDMRRTVDRMLENTLSGNTGWTPENWSLPLDVRETADEYQVQASIPGISPDDLEITYNNNVLTIRGETRAEEEKEGTQYHLRERRFGSFARSLQLPTAVNSDGIQANYDAGVLTLHLPKAEEAKPRRIAIGGQKMIEGQAKNGK